MELVEGYEHGDVELKIYSLGDGTRRYWLRAGAALLEFDTERFAQLCELLIAYTEENADG